MGLPERLRRLDDAVLGPPRVQPWWYHAFGGCLITTGFGLRALGDALDSGNVLGAVLGAVVVLLGLTVLALASRRAVRSGDRVAAYGAGACWVALGVVGPAFGVRQPVALAVHAAACCVGVVVLVAAARADRRPPATLGAGDGPATST